MSRPPLLPTLSSRVVLQRALIACFMLAAVLVPALRSDARVAGPSGYLLPDLVALPPTDVYVSDELDGCDAYERVEDGAARCLRYDTIFGNFGRGALELRYRIDQLGRDQQVRQRVFRRDGTFKELVADRYELHPAHAHFHYANFAVARLWDSDETGRRLGKKPVRVSKKAGFCITDGQKYWNDDRAGEQTYKYPDACWPTNPGDQTISQINGLSVGWTDAYESSRTSQYVEVTGLTDGYYILEVVIDPLNTLLEVDDTNNTTSAFILLRGGEAKVAARR